MTLECKICGVSDSKILNFIVNHKYSPQFIGFIVNYPKSKRYIEFDKLKELININKRNSQFVAVLVKPNEDILEKIKDLNFDYYQIYDTSPEKIKSIKSKYNRKIISAITVETKTDIDKYKELLPFSEIILFDSKGYEKSIGFDHSMLENIPDNFKKMIAGNIQIDDIPNFKNTKYVVDISGSLENENGKKDINKIDKLLNKVHNINL